MSVTSYDKNKIRFLLLEGIHSSAIKVLNTNGYHNIKHVTSTLNEEELHNELLHAHFIGVRSRTHLTPELLSKAPKLLAVGCFCIGTDQVNLPAAARAGVPVFNAPYSNTRSVAELVLGEAILLCRSIPEKNRLAHQGVWKKNAEHAYEIRGKTLGIIGYGSIGMQLGALAEAIGMHVLYYDIATRLPIGNACPTDTLQALLKQSDVVSLHVPDLASTQNMINADTFAMMKKNAIFINASRGKTVNIDDLAKALLSEHLLGAAIDVFPEEPSSNKDPFFTPLQGIKNVILTPHIGGSTQEAQENIGKEVAEKLVTFCDNGSTLSAVNFPEVALPAYPERHRLLHIHQNIPGVLTSINHVLSNNNVNISGQYLQTKGDVGYAVTDVDNQHGPDLKTALSEIPSTIRVRLLF